MNKSYIKTYFKTYVWLLAFIACTLSLSAAPEVTTAQHVDEIAVILVSDGTNPKSLKDRIVALYEKVKQVVQDFRSKPAEDPNKLKRTLSLEILKLLAKGHITPIEIRYLRDNQALIEKLSDKSLLVIVEGMGNLSLAHTENNTPEQLVEGMGNLSLAHTAHSIPEHNTVTKTTQKISKSTGPLIVAHEIIQHLSRVLAELTKIISQENKALVDKVNTLINDLKKDDAKKIDTLKAELRLAFQKSLLQCFTEHELNELHNFLTNPVFKKLLNNAPLLKEIFFKNLSPEIISKLSLYLNPA